MDTVTDIKTNKYGHTQTDRQGHRHTNSWMRSQTQTHTDAKVQSIDGQTSKLPQIQTDRHADGQT